MFVSFIRGSRDEFGTQNTSASWEIYPWVYFVAVAKLAPIHCLSLCDSMDQHMQASLSFTEQALE